MAVMSKMNILLQKVNSVTSRVKARFSHMQSYAFWSPVLSSVSDNSKQRHVSHQGHLGKQMPRIEVLQMRILFQGRRGDLIIKCIL